MGMTIKNRPESTEPPRKGVHLRATPQERAVECGYTGSISGPLCRTGDGHYDGTALSARVTCACCLVFMRDKLKYPITEDQSKQLEELGHGK